MAGIKQAGPSDQWVVVMVEPALPGEKLTVTEQINEVFGPFTEEEVDAWTARMEAVMERAGEDRCWLIIPLSKPSVVRELDTQSN